MRQVILYIAMSLDGYIAGEDESLDFLSLVASPGEDYGYDAFIKTIDTVIMGRKTYDKVLSFGIDFPHRDKKCYVLSKSKKGKDDNVEFYQGDTRALIDLIMKQPGKNIFVDGGSETIHELMTHELINQYVISIIPVLLGHGVPLFKTGRPEQELILVKNQSFPKGLVQLWYNVK